MVCCLPAVVQHVCKCNRGSAISAVAGQHSEEAMHTHRTSEGFFCFLAKLAKMLLVFFIFRIHSSKKLDQNINIWCQPSSLATTT